MSLVILSLELLLVVSTISVIGKRESFQILLGDD